MQNIHQTISKGLEKKYFKGENIEVTPALNIREKASKYWGKIQGTYEKMNEFFGLENSRQAQSIYYGMLSFITIVPIIVLFIIS